MLGAHLDRRFSIPDRSGRLLRHTRRHPRERPRSLASVGARRDADQLGEAGAEGFAFDLSSYDDVRANAEAIYERLAAQPTELAAIRDLLSRLILPLS
jgi:hypothetical protein